MLEQLNVLAARQEDWLNLDRRLQLLLQIVKGLFAENLP